VKMQAHLAPAADGARLVLRRRKPDPSTPACNWTTALPVMTAVWLALGVAVLGIGCCRGVAPGRAGQLSCAAHCRVEIDVENSHTASVYSTQGFKRTGTARQRRRCSEGIIPF
jgi:hypothetical protein